MSEAVVPPIVDPPRQKRKYTRRKPRKVSKIAGTVKPAPTIVPAVPPRPRYGAPKAMEEVDRQLATAISQKPAYHEQLATLFSQTALTQQRLERLNQQIQELVNLQRQLDGEGPAQVRTPDLDPRMVAMMPSPQPAPMFGEVPQGVASIPARQPKPTPNGNAAEQVKGDRGWE